MSKITAVAEPLATHGAATGTMMMALVYGGPGQRTWQAMPKPIVRDPGDAIVRITTSTICGTDLHIMKGDVPTVTPGRILGHEGIGIIESVGAQVTMFKAGDKVLISCISACGKCGSCRNGCIHTARVVDGSWATR